MSLFNLFLILVGLALVLLNGFFVAAEFGMVKLRNTRVAALVDEYPIRGSILAKVHEQLDAYLSACQLGITLASLGLGWIGEPAFSRLLTPLLHAMGFMSSTVIEFISFIFAFSLISFLHIVVGELMPKSLAIRQSEQISLWTAVPLYGFYWLMYPIIWVLNSCSNFLLKLLDLDVIHPSEQAYSNDEIKLILRSSQIHGELTPQASSILAHTLELADLQAMDVMRSSDDIVMIHTPISKRQLVETITRTRFSRYPVYDRKKSRSLGCCMLKTSRCCLKNIRVKTPCPYRMSFAPFPKCPIACPLWHC